MKECREIHFLDKPGQGTNVCLPLVPNDRVRRVETTRSFEHSPRYTYNTHPQITRGGGQTTSQENTKYNTTKTTQRRLVNVNTSRSSCLPASPCCTNTLCHIPHAVCTHQHLFEHLLDYRSQRKTKRRRTSCSTASEIVLKRTLTGTHRGRVFACFLLPILDYVICEDFTFLAFDVGCLRLAITYTPDSH